MPETTYGMQAAQTVMVSEGRWPRLKLQNGDRVRFHFLTDGNDPWFHASKFHSVGEGMQTRDVVCLRALTRGVEACQLCGPGAQLVNRFGCWVWVDYTLHSYDNPDENGEPWEQRKVKTAAGGERTVFVEQVGQPKYLTLRGGRNQAWFHQFNNAWMTSGDLRKHLYELLRTGEQLETEYTLSSIKEDPIPPDIFGKEEIKNLPEIEQVFRDTVSSAEVSGLLGTDSLDTESPEQLPTIETAAAETDDLI